MSNIFKSPEKVANRKFLWDEIFSFLDTEGWSYEKASGFGKKRIYRISRSGETYLVSAKTTQDTWFAYLPIDNGSSWQTLEDVDVVLVASVDNKENPREARVHWIPADRVSACLSASLAEALKRSNKAAHPTQGHWISLYEQADKVTGAGLGIEFPAKRTQPMPIMQNNEKPDEISNANDGAKKSPKQAIEDAKKMVAEALGVDASAIKININA